MIRAITHNSTIPTIPTGDNSFFWFCPWSVGIRAAVGCGPVLWAPCFDFALSRNFFTISSHTDIDFPVHFALHFGGTTSNNSCSRAGQKRISHTLLHDWIRSTRSCHTRAFPSHFYDHLWWVTGWSSPGPTPSTPTPFSLKSSFWGRRRASHIHTRAVVWRWNSNVPLRTAVTCTACVIRDQ